MSAIFAHVNLKSEKCEYVIRSTICFTVYNVHLAAARFHQMIALLRTPKAKNFQPFFISVCVETRKSKRKKKEKKKQYTECDDKCLVNFMFFDDAKNVSPPPCPIARCIYISILNARRACTTIIIGCVV